MPYLRVLVEEVAVFLQLGTGMLKRGLLVIWIFASACSSGSDDVSVTGVPQNDLGTAAGPQPPDLGTTGTSDLAGRASSDLATKTGSDLAGADLAGVDLTSSPPDLTTPGDGGGSTPNGPIITPRSNINASAATGDQFGGDLAIDPTDVPYFNHLIAASDDTSGQALLYETNNGATSWRTRTLPTPAGYGAATRHPSVAYDTQGRGLVSMLAYDGSGNSVVAVSRRAAGAGAFDGLTAIAGTQRADRARIVADRGAASPRVDTVYVVFSDGASSVKIVRSTDGGVSFGAPVQVNDDGSGLTSPYLSTARDGTLYVTWLDSGRGQLRVDRSTDGGATWGTDNVIASLSASGTSVTSPAFPQGARLGAFCDVDRSTSPTSGFLYCVYHDSTASNGLDIFLRKSTDGGATWSGALRINDDPAGVAADQFLPRIQIDDRSSAVNVAWYDTRNDPAHVSTDVYFTRADDDVAFVPSVRVTTQSSDATAGAGYGESIGMEAFFGRARVFWTDTRTGDEDTFSCIIDFAHFNFVFSTNTLTIPSGGSGSMTIGIQAVGPFTSPVTLSFRTLPPGISGSFSTNPVPVGGSTNVTLSAGSAAPGTYTIGINGQGGGESDTRELTVVVQ